VAKGGEALGWKTSGEEDGVRRLYMGWMGKKRAVMKEWRVKWGVKGWREQLGGWRDRVASRSGVDGKDQTRQSTGGVRIDTSEGLHGWMGFTGSMYKVDMYTVRMTVEYFGFEKMRMEEEKKIASQLIYTFFWRDREGGTRRGHGTHTRVLTEGENSQV
jgi:hypothetical protein